MAQVWPVETSHSGPGTPSPSEGSMAGVTLEMRMLGVQGRPRRGFGGEKCPLEPEAESGLRGSLLALPCAGHLVAHWGLQCWEEELERTAGPALVCRGGAEPGEGQS